MTFKLSFDLVKQFEQITYFDFKARSLPPSKMSWDRSGSGKTTVTLVDNVVYFDDYVFLDQKALDKKKWIFTDNRLEFWHLQQNDYLHVFDFDLSNTCNKLVSIAPHICLNDHYSGTLSLTRQIITFSIFIKSQVKNERIQYIYG